MSAHAIYQTVVDNIPYGGFLACHTGASLGNDLDFKDVDIVLWHPGKDVLLDYFLGMGYKQVFAGYPENSLQTLYSEDGKINILLPNSQASFHRWEDASHVLRCLYDEGYPQAQCKEFRKALFQVYLYDNEKYIREVDKALAFLYNTTIPKENTHE